MDLITDKIIKHKRGVVITAVIVALICLLLQFLVTVNYNIVDYLPEEAQSTRAIEVMGGEFDEVMPNTRVLIHDISIEQAITYKQQFEAIPEVVEVMWLDDVVDLKVPLELLNHDLVDQYYNIDSGGNNGGEDGGDALFEVSIFDGEEQGGTEALDEIVGDNGYVVGEAVESAYMQGLSMNETRNAMLIAVPLILIILLVSTSSWIEPLFFFCAIGAAIVVNMASNLLLGEVSFVTQTVTPILQLAVSLDYAIFLLHRFELYRHDNESPEFAMKHAVKKAFPTIGASALTTICGFFALTFMDFGIGSNLGLSLIKGVALSFISVIIFFPALVLTFYKVIDKTKHRNVMPKFKSVPNVVAKIKVPCIIIVALVIIPSYLAQGANDFSFGSSIIADDSKIARETKVIEDEFGGDNRIVILVPRGKPATELELSKAIEKLDHVSAVVSYANTVGTEIPSGFLSEDQTSQFYSENYARIIVYTNTEVEGDVAFDNVENIRAITDDYYDTSYQLGNSASTYDVREVVTRDNPVVNTIAVLAIAFVILVTLRSVSLPIMLVLTIETSIWINLSIPYFSGGDLNFIGYLIVSTVQLGATVDYAILLTHRYIEKRESLLPHDAIRASLSETFGSILISALVLSIAGIGLALTSTNPMVSEMGVLIARGTVLSFVMVICFLSSILVPFDKVIQKTTYRTHFLNRGKE